MSNPRPRNSRPARVHQEVTEDLDALRFNTAISALMVFNNEAMTWEMKPRAVLREF